MDPITIITLATALIKAGVATYAQISEAIKANKGQLDSNQVNIILDAIAADDDRRAEIAADIAAGRI